MPAYPAGTNSLNGLSWAPATDGLGNISGHVSSSVAEYLRTHREAERETLRLLAAARLVDEERRNAHDTAAALEAPRRSAPASAERAMELLDRLTRLG